jgi:hypothetical protein
MRRSRERRFAMRRSSDRRAGMSRFDWLGLGLVVAVAAVLRLVGIDSRHGFDADQGHDMLTLLAFTRGGEIPLLGPKTSVG